MVERIGDSHDMVDSFATSQEAKTWTERSKDSKLNEIFRNLDKKVKEKPTSNKLKEIQKLQNLLIKGEYKKFQKEIGVSNCNGKLGNESLETLNNYLVKLDEIEVSQQETQQGLASITNPQQTTHDNIDQTSTVNTPEKIDNHVDSMKITRAAKRYLSKYETLSTEIYNLLFSGKEEIEQGNLGNCYLISGIIELSNTQYFDTLMRTSISRVKFKDDGSPGFSVKIPLGEPDGRDILIKDSELKLARVQGNIGYKLLELAYVKNKRPNNKAGNTYYPITNEEIKKTEGGFTFEALATYLGNNNVGFCHFGSTDTAEKKLTLSYLPQDAKNEIENYLKNYNGSTGNTYTEIGTSSIATEVGRYKLSPLHSYALVGVKTENGKITYIDVKDPNGYDLKLTLDEFFHAFDHIVACKIKVDTFLDDKGVSYA